MTIGCHLQDCTELLVLSRVGICSRCAFRFDVLCNGYGNWKHACCLLVSVWSRSIDPGGRVWGFWPLKICRRVRSMFWPPKMSHYFIENCCWITESFTSSKMKDKCQKWKVNYFFKAPETVWWLDLTDPDPHILRQIYATGIKAFLMQKLWKCH